MSLSSARPSVICVPVWLTAGTVTCLTGVNARSVLTCRRYKEQKFRLKKSGISRVLYVIEGAVEDETFRPLLAAIQCSMSVHESIEPVRTKGEEDTAIYLSHVTQYLTRQLEAYRAGDGGSVPAWSTYVLTTL